MRNAFLLIDSANSHAENIRNTKVHPRGHKETEDQPSNIGKEPQHIVQGLQEHDKIAFEMLKKQQRTIAQQESTIAKLCKKSFKKEKRKTNEYNLLLKRKM